MTSTAWSASQKGEKSHVKELSKLVWTANNLLLEKPSINTITGYSQITWKFSKLNELDRILEIQDYMEDQEKMIKFKTEHYQEYRFHSIHDRQPTPFVNNIVTTTACGASPSPECSPVRESFAQIIRNFSPYKESSDDSESDSESDTTKKQTWSTDDSSDSSSDEDE